MGRYAKTSKIQTALLVAAFMSATTLVYLVFSGGQRSAKSFLTRDRFDGLPQRAIGAPTGSEFLQTTKFLDTRTREARVMKQIEKGNIPPFLRQFVPITIKDQDRRGKNRTLIIWVMRDYIAVGSDKDYIRVPLTPIAARKIADDFFMMLPTAKIVDEIYKSASVHLHPVSMTPGPRMASVDYILRHNRLIKLGLATRDIPAPSKYLVAGHKKDVVESKRLETNPDRVAIYGWHRDEDSPIQPLSIVHGIHYLDYSHGVRLISRNALLDGKPVDLTNLEKDRNLSPLITYEAIVAH